MLLWVNGGIGFEVWFVNLLEILQRKLDQHMRGWMMMFHRWQRMDVILKCSQTFKSLFTHFHWCSELVILLLKTPEHKSQECKVTLVGVCLNRKKKKTNFVRKIIPKGKEKERKNITCESTCLQDKKGVSASLYTANWLKHRCFYQRALKSGWNHKFSGCWGWTMRIKRIWTEHVRWMMDISKPSYSAFFPSSVRKKKKGIHHISNSRLRAKSGPPLQLLLYRFQCDMKKWNNWAADLHEKVMI